MQKKILFGVLNWGLGHATRSMPVIDKLLQNRAEVFIASDGEALDLLQRHHPELNFFELPPYNVRYPYQSIFFNILRFSGSISKAIMQERKEAKRLCAKLNADAIVSDSRFGFRASGCYNVFISHQISLQLANGFLNVAGTFANKMVTGKFDELWIPDFEGENSIAGKLSDNADFIKHYYVGILSRLYKMDVPTLYDMAIVLSGPEPQRSIFEKLVVSQLQGIEKNAVLVRGTNKAAGIKVPPGVEVIDLAGSDTLNRIINQSRVVIARSGYSTVMDMVALGKKAFFVPTPGQTEQEYLARYLKSKNLYDYQEQHLFDLKAAVRQADKYPGFKAPEADFLSPVVKNLLEKI